MFKLDLEALSLNKAYRGRRFTTPDLKTFKTNLNFVLPKLQLPSGKLSVRYVFGVSSKRSDADNLIKCFQDGLADKYGFNDCMIYEIYVKKEDVSVGREFIKFDILPFVE